MGSGVGVDIRVGQVKPKNGQYKDINPNLDTTMEVHHKIINNN